MSGPVWTPTRWIIAIGVLTVSPLAFRMWPDATAAQGFGIGWITAALVILLNRPSKEPPP
jgi:hypothetical protein